MNENERNRRIQCYLGQTKRVSMHKERRKTNKKYVEQAIIHLHGPYYIHECLKMYSCFFSFISQNWSPDCVDLCSLLSCYCSHMVHSPTITVRSSFSSFVVNILFCLNRFWNFYFLFYWILFYRNIYELALKFFSSRFPVRLLYLFEIKTYTGFLKYFENIPSTHKDYWHNIELSVLESSCYIW